MAHFALAVPAFYVRLSIEIQWSTGLEREAAATGKLRTTKAAARLLGVSPRLPLQLARQKKVPDKTSAPSDTA